MRKVNKSIECVDRGLDLLLYILASGPTHHKISKMAIGKRFLQQALYVRQNPFRIQHLPRQYLTSAAAPALYSSKNGCRSLSTSKKLLKYEYPEISPEEEAHIVKSPYSDVVIPEINLADYVWRDVDKWPERPALVSLK